MAAVVAGLGHCFELENKECEYIMCTHIHTRTHTRARVLYMHPNVRWELNEAQIIIIKLLLPNMGLMCHGD